MIYFDNAATTLVKPPEVYKNMLKYAKICGNPGRSGHKPSMTSSKLIFDTRQSICDLFNFDKPENVIFTYNATYALNLAIKGFITEKCTVLTSSFEHNSTIRPLMSLENVNTVIVQSELYNHKQFLDNFKNSITEDTKFAVINHVSNVFGYILPIGEIDEICYKNNIKLILDISQSAGILQIDLSEFKSVIAICMPAHKGLYGPMGLGVLILTQEIPKSLINGGTGSLSQSLYQPDFLPDMLESGTANVPAIGALKHGINYIQKNQNNIQSKLFELAKYTANELSKISDTEVFFCDDVNLQSGVISFYKNNSDCEDIALKLAKHNICTRAGLHCSPLAHASAGTLSTIRLSFSSFNNLYEINQFIQVYKSL